MHRKGEGQERQFSAPFSSLSRFKLPAYKQWAHCAALLTQIGSSENGDVLFHLKHISLFKKLALAGMQRVRPGAACN